MILIHQKKIGDGGIKYFTANYFTILDNQSKSGMYIFYNLDTLTGCETKKIIDVKVRNCVFKNLAWHDYNGPKEYNEYRKKQKLSFLFGRRLCLCLRR